MSGRSVRSTTTHDDDARENDANDAIPRERGRANDDAMDTLCFVKRERIFELVRRGFFDARWVVNDAVGDDAEAKETRLGLWMTDSRTRIW